MEFLFFAVLSLMSAAVVAISVKIYRSIPSGWLCDYGEIPSEIHFPGKRLKYRKSGVAISWIIFMYVQYEAFRTAAEPIEIAVSEFFLTAVFAVLANAAFSDIDYMIIPDQCCAAMIVLTILRIVSEVFRAGVLNTAGFVSLCIPSVCGAAVMGIIMTASALLGRVVSGAESVGMGDLKLMTVCGAYLGSVHGDLWLEKLMIFYVMAVMTNAVWNVMMIFFKKVSYGEAMPFGPWIAASALICSVA